MQKRVWLAAAVCALALATAGSAAAEKSAADLKKQGDALLADGKKDEALSAYVRSMDMDPSYTPAYDAAAPIWFAQRKYDVAIRWLKAAVERRPSYSLGWYNLAFAYRKISQYEPAIEAYEKFMELRPEEPDPWFGVGMTYKAMGQNDKAKAAFEAYVEREKRVEKQKFVEQAKKEIDTLGQGGMAAPPPPGPTPGVTAEGNQQNMTKRQLAELTKKQGDELRLAGDLPGAEAKYKAAIATDPDYGAAHNELGTLLFLQKKSDDAIAEFELAVKLDPKDDLAWYNLAHARRKNGKHKEAVDAYRAYIALKPENPDPYYGMGHALKALGDLAGARDAFTKYVRLEKRATEQKWVEKAKQEIAELEKGGIAPAPAQPVVDAAKPAVDGAKPAADGAKPAADGAKPAADGAKPAADGTKPAVDGAKPAVDGAKPAVDGAKPAADGAKPAVDGAKPAADGAKPAADGAKPAADGAKPDVAEVKPPDVVDTLKPGDATKPADVPAGPTVEAVAPSRPSAGDAVAAKGYREQGDAAFAKKEYDNAANAYRSAANADPADRESRYRLGVTLAAFGDLPSAITAWESVLLLEPTHERARRNIEFARRRIAKNGAQVDDEPTVIGKVKALVADGRYASALVILDGFTKTDPSRLKNIDVLVLRAEARLGAGEAAAALTDFEAALAMSPRSARLYRGLADSHLTLGDTARARYYYEQFIIRAELDPDEKPRIPAIQQKLDRGQDPSP